MIRAVPVDTLQRTKMKHRIYASNAHCLWAHILKHGECTCV